MRNVLPALALSTALSIPQGALAQGEGVEPFLRPAPSRGERGFSLGARAGVGIPLGRATGVGGDDLSGTFALALPLQVEAGWRFDRRWYAGAYFQYAFAWMASPLRSRAGCEGAGTSCSAYVLRFGAEVAYTIAPAARLAPWVGLGAGYEIAGFTVSSSAQTNDATYRGFEVAHLSGGADYRVSPAVRIGPFATVTAAQYSSIETPFNPVTRVFGQSQSLDLEKAFHVWLVLGVRGTFDL
jgi:outer membrane protein